MSAAEGQQVGRMVIDTLVALRTQTSFDLFWEKVAKLVESTDVEEPHLSRQRKMPKRFDPGSSSGDFHTSPKLYYRQLYYGAVDNVINCLKDRFNQPGYKLYCNLEQLLLKACQQKAFEDEFQVICSFYKEDFYPDILRAQLLTFGINFAAYNEAHEVQHAPTIFDIRDYFWLLSVAQRDLLHQVVRVMKLILVMPATNASSERSFSALRRVKSYLRSTMTQERLNHLMVLHVHKERTDSLDTVAIANDYVKDSEHRLRLLGTFH